MKHGRRKNVKSRCHVALIRQLRPWSQGNTLVMLNIKFNTHGKSISVLDAFSEIIIQLSRMPDCIDELKHIASVIERTRKEMEEEAAARTDTLSE